MRRAIALGALLVIGGLSLAVAAFQAPAPPPGPNPTSLAATKIERVKDNLYMITLGIAFVFHGAEEMLEKPVR